MANRERGEVPLVVPPVNGGAPTSYTLRLSINALCALEDLVSKPDKPVSFHQVLARAAMGRLTEVRAVIWAALQEHHKADFPTMDAVGELIQSVGLTELNTQLTALSETASADVEDVQEVRGANPHKARVTRRRGGRSTSTPDVSA